MASEKQKLIKGVTPRGVCAWPYLNAPDEYKGKKSFKTNLTLSAEDSKELIEKITAATTAVEAAEREKLQEIIKNGKTGEAKAKAKKALAALTVGYPYVAEVDDDGEETGNYVFKFKANAEFEDSKTKAVKKIVIPLFDARGKPTKAQIWGGSTIRVAYALVPYYVASANQCGISLRIEGIKVINLVSSGGGRNADALGFGEEEEGYSSSDLDSDESGEDELTAGSDDTGEDEF